MYRRRPGGRTRAARSLVLAGLLTIALAAGCSSGSRSPSRTSDGGPSDPDATAPTSTRAPSPSAVGKPVQPSPTPVKRTLTRPAGAKIVDFSTCIEPDNIVLLYLDRQIFATGDAAQQQVQLAGIDGLLTPQLKHLRQARGVWLADGYPANFPTVKEIGEYISIYEQLQTARSRRDLSPIPRLYVALQKVNAQYGADAGPTVCEQ